MTRLELMRVIVARRMAYGLTQGDMAKRIGVAQNRVSEYETCRHSPSADILLRMLNVVGLEVTVPRKNELD